MIISSPFVIIVSAEEHQELTDRAHGARTAHRDVIRARIILAAAEDRANASIAADLGLHVDTVRKWRRRFVGERLAGLVDRSRTGRPRQFTAVQVAEVKALACELPTTCEVPLARWSCPDLAAEAARRGVVDSVSASTVRRWLAADAIKPWQHRSWIFPRDPDFAVKAGRVLDLYARRFDGAPVVVAVAMRAALALTEAATRLADHPDPVPDALWERVRQHFNEPAAAALLLALGTVNLWNRVNVITAQIPPLDQGKRQPADTS